jgi:hypothetical protein
MILVVSTENVDSRGRDMVGGLPTVRLKVRANAAAEAWLVWRRLVNFNATAEQIRGCESACGMRRGRGPSCV